MWHNSIYILVKLETNAPIYNTNYGIDDNVSSLCFPNVFNIRVHGISISIIK